MARGEQAETPEPVPEAVHVAPRHALEEVPRLERRDEPQGGAAVHAEPPGKLAHAPHLGRSLERLEDLQRTIHCLHLVAHDATRRS